MATFSPERPVYLLGESFGGILALAVAANRPDLVDRVVLANPATSYPKSVWPVIGPLLPQVPKVKSLAARFLLAVSLSDLMADQTDQCSEHCTTQQAIFFAAYIYFVPWPGWRFKISSSRWHFGKLPAI